MDLETLVLVGEILDTEEVTQSWAHDLMTMASSYFLEELDKRGYEIVKKEPTDAKD